MEPIPQIVPISDMHNRSAAILSLLTNRSVYLAQRSRAVAVLVSVDQWDAVAQELRDLRAFKASHSPNVDQPGP